MRRWMVVLAAVTVSVPVLMPGRVEAGGCDGVSFASGAERDWVEAVYDHTDMTCGESRWVYRNRPGLRDEFPGNHVWTSWATRVPSPASVSAAGTEWCRITTVEKYRAPVVPFGDHVLFSFRTERTFTYNGTAVGAGSAFVDADTTANGWRWHFDGVVAAQEGYIAVSGWNRYQHQTDRWGKFSTDSVAELTGVHSTLHDRIWFQANGDWATMNTAGVSDCRNP